MTTASRHHSPSCNFLPYLPPCRHSLSCSHTYTYTYTYTSTHHQLIQTTNSNNNQTPKIYKKDLLNNSQCISFKSLLRIFICITVAFGGGRTCCYLWILYVLRCLTGHCNLIDPLHLSCICITHAFRVTVRCSSCCCCWYLLRYLAQHSSSVETRSVPSELVALVYVLNLRLLHVLHYLM
jgi:hypothetical protein